ncbi:polymorphic toxin-type HINT domain-containing protein [Tahibacter sp. UC22_41]|uniref:polymorphic toxin-type HINT domain-containing protein n=1 Tax=Tahibacter sp. UC22_41 TaxID=3350178 RepID=UPI0036DB86A8
MLTTLMALSGMAWGQQTLPDLLAPPPASVCAAPTASTEPGNVHMFPGRWWNPQRNGIGWDFFYGEGQQSMYLTWFTYDNNGRPVWLHGQAKSLEFNAVTGERTWQSHLWAAYWSATNAGRSYTPVGSVSVTFPNQTTTRAAVRWRWNVGSSIAPVGPLTYDECLYDTFRDQRQLQHTEGVINQAFSSNWFYRGLNSDPLVGWGVDLLIDIDPSNSHYIETAAAAIFDTAGRPVWLQSADDWGTSPPPDNTLSQLSKGALRYLRYTIPVTDPPSHPATLVCTGASSTCGAKAVKKDDQSEIFGRFGRHIQDAAYGIMRLDANVDYLLTGGASVQWPPSYNVPSFPTDVPVMRFDANHIIVDKAVCRIPTSQTSCTVQVSWSANDPTAQIRRLDLNNGQSPTSFASGLSSIKPDPLPLGARVQYEISYRYNGDGPWTTLRTPEVRVLQEGVIADAVVQDIACAPKGNNGCDLSPHDPKTGAIAGEASTDGGAALYSIPIKVPPGRNGVAPELALSYNSRSGNGIAGLGWGLSGFSAIQRCPRTTAQDGVGNAAALSFGNNDALCLDGERLVRTNAAGVVSPGLPYGVALAYYRTEINNFARVTQYGGDLTSANSCFKVEYKSGDVAYYGGAYDGSSCSGGGSRHTLYGHTAPLSWGIERSEDASGNSIQYTYTLPSQYGKGEHLPLAIHYTGNRAVPGDRRVELFYRDRPPADRSRSYQLGGLAERTQRLDRIVTWAGAEPVDVYTLSYTDPVSGGEGNLHSGRSALQSVQQCAAGGEDNGGGEACLPKTVINWNDLPPDYVMRPLSVDSLPAPSTPNGLGYVDRRVQTIGDLDGDGVRELLVHQLESSGFHTYLIKQNADRTVESTLDISSIAGSMLYFTQGMQTDFDGDGRADLLAADEGGYLRLYRWKLARGAAFAATPADTFEIPVTLSGVAPGHQLVSTDDFDGDGYADLLLRRRDAGCSGLEIVPPIEESKDKAQYGHVLCYYRNTTTSPGAVSFASGVQVHDWLHESPVGGLSAVGDLNSDGISDLVIMTPTSQAGGSANTVTTVLLSRAPGYTPPAGCVPTSSPVRWYSCDPTLLGLPGPNAGYRTNGAAMRWHDVNGDGLVDLLYALPGPCAGIQRICAKGSWQVQIANGRGFDAAVAIGGNTDALLMTSGMEDNRLRYAGLLPSADADSDGKLDLLYPVGLAARQCTAVTVNYRNPGNDGKCSYTEPPPGGGTENVETELCEDVVWMCGNDPAADIAGTASPYQLPSIVGMPDVTYVPATETDTIYTPTAFRASFTAIDQSLYYMAGLRFVPTATGYDAQSFGLDASGPNNRAGHRVAMTLNDTTSLNNAEDLHGDGLVDLTTRVGCYNHGINAAYCHFVGNGTTGPATFTTIAAPNQAPVATSVATLNNGLRTFVNENVGVLENPGTAPTLPGLVRTITNGLGDSATWTYYPLSSKGERGTGKLPLYSLPGTGYVDANHFYFQSTMPVVGAMARNSVGYDLTGFRTWRYGYSEAMYNRIGRGFQGFRAIVREQVMLSGQQERVLRELSVFHQKFPLTGKLEFTRSGAPLAPITNEALVDWVLPFTDVSYSWGCDLKNRTACATGGAPTAAGFDYPFLNAQTTTSYDPGFAEISKRKKVAEVLIDNADPAGSAGESGWDAYGNLGYTITSAKDFDDVSGSIAFVQNTSTSRKSKYVNTTDTASWWPGKLEWTEETTYAVQYGAVHLPPADVLQNAQTLRTDYTWNPDRTPATVIVQNADPNLRTQKTFVYPSAGFNFGLPTAVAETFSDAIAATSYTRTTQTIYDPAGDGYFPLKSIDASGAETAYVYRKRDGQIREITLPTKVRARTYYDAFGRGFRTDSFTVASNGVETPLGQSVHTAWNACSAGVCPGVGNGGVRLGNPAQPAEHNAAYRVTTVQNGAPTRVIWYDMLGREVKNAVRGFDGTFAATLSEYDRLGTLSGKSVPFYLTSASAAAPFAATFAYDRAGRVTRKTGPDGEIAVGQTSPGTGYAVSTYAYAGNRTTVQVGNSRNLCVPSNLCFSVVRYNGVAGLMRSDDALGGVTRYWSDAAGRPLAITDAKTNAASPGQVPAGKATRASYNVLGQRTSSYDPNQGEWSFVYNGLGELVEQTDARLLKTTIRRDAAGRPIWQISSLPAWSGSPAEHYRDEWSYQATTGLLGEMRRCITTSPVAECKTTEPNPNATWAESYVYDYGRLAATTAKQRITTNNSVLEHSTLFHYDANFGREKAVEYASGLKVQRIFTKYGALRDVLDADTGERFWGIGGMDAFGNVTRQDYGNGVVGNYAYDPISGRPVRKQWTRVDNGVPSVIDSIEYGYDVLANLSAQRRSGVSVANTTESYTYDKLQRLKSSSVPGSGYNVGYDYDALGNLTRKSDYSRDVADAYLYAAAGTNGCGPNVATAILMPSGTNYDRLVNFCDANGNVIRSQRGDTGGNVQLGERRFRYDATNRPRNINDEFAPGSPTAMFTYAPDGRRVYEVLSERYYPNPGEPGANRLRYVVQGQRGYQVELANDASGWAGAVYRHEIGDVSVVLRSVSGQGTTRDVAFKTLDRLGSPLGVMDRTGQFIQRSESGWMNTADTRLTFSPFGAARNSDFRPRNPSGEMPGRLNLTPSTRLGFTGHEHLDTLGLIHMNGRVYDYRLGRFLSVDPFIQFPANSQSLNPYSYIMNNPLAGTDPTGYKIRRDSRTRLNGNGPCMGSLACDFERTFSGPVEDLRNSVGASSRRQSNGFDPLQPTTSIVAIVTIGKPLDIKDGVLIAGDIPEGVDDSVCDEVPEACRDRAARQEGIRQVQDDIVRGVEVVDTVATTVVEEGANPVNYVPGSAWTKFLRWVGIGRRAETAQRIEKIADSVCCCFPAGTKVWTAEGAITIENVKVGQLVLSRDPVTGETAQKPVTALITTKPKRLYELTIRGADGHQEFMRATGDHPYWVKDKGWVTVDALEPGMVFTDLGKGELLLDGVVLSGETAETFNFTVGDFHSYFAGELKVFVHNCSCFAPDVLEAAARVGVNLNDARIVDGVAKLKIGLSDKLNWSDIKLLKSAMRDRGATAVQVESGFIANPDLNEFLMRRVNDGRPFQGGTVRWSDSPDSDFVIDFPL